MPDQSINMVSEQLSVTFYTKKGRFTGSISLPRGARLIEVLNDGLANIQSNESAYIRLSDVTLLYEGGGRISYDVMYIAKSNILIVATPDRDTARGIGAQSGMKSPKFVQKSPVSVRLEIQEYTITGNIHCNYGETVLDLLNAKSMFLPLTDAKVRTPQTDRWELIPFLAVNRQEVFSVYEI